MSEISVEELAQWRASGRDFVLLDVREPYEVAQVNLSDALNVPMSEFLSRADELDPGKTVAVICHYGSRSERIAQFLEMRGFGSVYNVEGGIDAYAERVDPTLPRY